MSWFFIFSFSISFVVSSFFSRSILSDICLSLFLSRRDPPVNNPGRRTTHNDQFRQRNINTSFPERLSMLYRLPPPSSLFDLIATDTPNVRRQVSLSGISRTLSHSRGIDDTLLAIDESRVARVSTRNRAGFHSLYVIVPRSRTSDSANTQRNRNGKRTSRSFVVSDCKYVCVYRIAWRSENLPYTRALSRLRQETEISFFAKFGR